MSTFSFFTRIFKNEPFPFHLVKTDMHSHLIPGVDDGAPTVEESILLINGLADLGYEKLITSPHIMQDLYPNSPASIDNGFQQIKARNKKLILKKAAAEYFLDDHVTELLANNKQLLTISEQMVLVEFSFLSPPLGMREMLFGLQIKGYKPILAHPERYSYFHGDLDKYHELKDSGCTLQCNILSFGGYYGRETQEAAEYLVKAGLVDMLGTDLHHQRHLHALRKLPFTKALQRLMEKELINTRL